VIYSLLIQAKFESRKMIAAFILPYMFKLMRSYQRQGLRGYIPAPAYYNLATVLEDEGSSVIQSL
jgi:hypothetical protein